MSIALVADPTVAPVCPGIDPDSVLAALMDEYERPIYTFVASMLRDADGTLDCVQDTFLRAYEALKRGRSINSAWLYTVARNRAMDEFRRRRRLGPEREALDTLPAPTASVDSLVVQSVLDRMPPLDREVLYLFVVAGFRTDEIGTILGMNGAAIRQRLYRARERFRTLYGAAD
jgi:RNA polymerase sigma-70 factor (ECF subfamily)